MTVTTPRISFGLYALALKQDSTPICAPLQSFSKIQDLKTGNVTLRPYATYEPNFWLLSGDYRFLPEDTSNVHVGLMSLFTSNEANYFVGLAGPDLPPEVVPIVLSIEFSQLHSTEGLTLHFSQQTDDYATVIKIEYFDGENGLIQSDFYSPTTWEFSTEIAVTGFKKIEISFYSTNKPYRYLRVTGIDFGKLIVFSGTDIQQASVIEQTDPLSTTIPIGTMDLTLFSSNAAFSMINPIGDYTALQYRQPLAVYEDVEDDQVFIGDFFLDEWENKSDTVINFRCVDMLGILDTQPYFGGLWSASEGKVVSALLREMFEAISIPYDLDSDLDEMPIIGWLPVCSYREALQQIAFAIGVHVSCSRSGVIQIYKTILAKNFILPDRTITTAEKGMDQSLTLRTLVTGVEITSHTYNPSSENVQLFSGTLTVGSHTITFNEPVHNLSITEPSGSTIIASGANYVVISTATEGIVTLMGQKYVDVSQVTGIYNTELDTNVKQNILSITGATLVYPAIVDIVAQRVYDYYTQRYLQKVKLFTPTTQVGECVLVDTLYQQKLKGVVEKMELDLAGGFVAQAEIVGVVNA